MLELKIHCDDADQARMYLNGPQYHNLISDLYQSLRSALKHGNDADVLKVVEQFQPDLATALDSHQGPY